MNTSVDTLHLYHHCKYQKIMLAMLKPAHHQPTTETTLEALYFFHGVRRTARYICYKQCLRWVKGNGRPWQSEEIQEVLIKTRTKYLRKQLARRSVMLVVLEHRSQIVQLTAAFVKCIKHWFLWRKPTIYVKVWSPPRVHSCRCFINGQCTTTCVKSSSNSDLANYSPRIWSQYT